MSISEDPTIHDLRTRVQRLEGEKKTLIHWLPPIVSVLAFGLALLSAVDARVQLNEQRSEEARREMRESVLEVARVTSELARLANTRKAGGGELRTARAVLTGQIFGLAEERIDELTSYEAIAVTVYLMSRGYTKQAVRFATIAEERARDLLSKLSALKTLGRMYLYDRQIAEGNATFEKYLAHIDSNEQSLGSQIAKDRRYLAVLHWARILAEIDQCPAARDKLARAEDLAAHAGATFVAQAESERDIVSKKCPS